ncbi:pyridoxamine 5'-phosphate oxidase family protein [Amycolatopsis keratiniphila]|uniref:Pyridoxamine 5'-phosphate oxidase n=1 Tax=Amycolatopsis keratiniphila subsp. keratiniphila TaxID=227715 RepID=A0A1W2LMX9_9PSEU|nr:pyridoxamine 5'-phosphate oxidase family protein [Amycolatopsis keratiniphila]OLZ52144.1 pyridoxamine 5'-phosphate oxidase [Amycolatopsis keratiniphila subsp. nogabecina]ONF64442.1 pyridoxamine 5'-phosphate oxidase [Amycolatopsis keratiniphila subsp. keratiniphila]SDU60563.1 General stress protein 26 [Amycolatopsis keratiniphila]
MLTPDDLEFLRRPLHGFLTVADGPVRPVWFEATADGTIQLFTPRESPKVRRLKNDPRASIIVAAPVGERERWVSVSGRATVEPDGAHELAARLAERYWDLEDPAHAGELAGIQTLDLVRLVIRPEKVSRYLM